MADLLGLFSHSIRKLRKANSISIDSWTFKLFYKVTTLILFLSTILTASRQFFGQQIACYSDKDKSLSANVLESFCLFNAKSNKNDGIYNSYYQWVPVYLVFMVFVFYLPRMLWLKMEGGLMELFGSGTTDILVEDAETKCEKLVNYFMNNIRNNYNTRYCLFIFCETLNLVVVISSLFMTDRFLNYQFVNYGIQVLNYRQLSPQMQNTHTNPMFTIFPRTASCSFNYNGQLNDLPSSVSVICVLGLNVINDKVFLVIWCWFVFLIVCSSICFISQLILWNSARIRYYIVYRSIFPFLKKKPGHPATAVQLKITRYLIHCSPGDWFVLYQISCAMNREFFINFLVGLVEKVFQGNQANQVL